MVLSGADKTVSVIDLKIRSRADDDHCTFRDFSCLRSTALCAEESFRDNCAEGTQVLVPLFHTAFIFQLTLSVFQLPPLSTPPVHSPLPKTKQARLFSGLVPGWLNLHYAALAFSSFCLSQQSC